jgi:hypothetical protein
VEGEKFKTTRNRRLIIEAKEMAKFHPVYSQMMIKTKIERRHMYVCVCYGLVEKPKKNIRFKTQ